ncbi:FBD-associated F-box protein At5g60610-like isoform X3 [Carex rostrata]
MADSNVEEVDRLSQLPEALLLQILSFLPTKFAARTSLLARRFRHLWTASPSFELDRSDFSNGRLFNNVTSRCLRLRDRSAPLLSFCLKANWRRPFSIKLISNWLNRAHLLGLRDLSLHIHAETIESLFPLILSFGSLHSLSINSVDSDMNYGNRARVPPSCPLTQLKYLCITARMSESGLRTFIMEQRNLEYLCIKSPFGTDADLSSQSVKTLKLRVEWGVPKVYLSFSKLEFLDLSISLSRELKQFHGDMPVLRKALVETIALSEKNVPMLRDILESITNVSELTLHIGTPYPKIRPSATCLRKLTSFDLCHPLVEPGRDMPDFPNLRSLKLSMCCYENALQDLICVLRHSPCIDSLHLIHVEGPSCYRNYCAPEVWQSKLPLNSEGNRKYALFSNLQTGDKKNEVIKLLSGENSS